MSAVDSLRWKTRVLKIMQARRPGLPLSLHRLRKRIEGGLQPDLFEIGGCGCFVDDPEEDVA